MSKETPHPPDGPRHVAIIMDGNGRWAQRRNLPRIEGHRRGVKNVRAAVEAARDLGVEVLTLFAFSAENWSRPKAEIDMLMNLLRSFLDQNESDLQKAQTCFRVIGRTQELPPDLQERLHEVEQKTAHHTKRTLALALSYGSRSEVIDAVRVLAHDIQKGRVDPDALTWDLFSTYLYTNGLPDPDLVIRTSGESRISNFLLLQSAYAEYFFSPVCWPEFKRRDFEAAIQTFHNRERRFGRTGEQLRQKTHLESTSL